MSITEPMLGKRCIVTGSAQGIGREMGPEGLSSFLEKKSIALGHVDPEE